MTEKNIIDDILNNNLEDIIDNFDNLDNFNNEVFNTNNDENDENDNNDIYDLEYYKDEVKSKDSVIKQKISDETYYIKLFNVFMIHYNNKFNKKDSFYKNINNDNETNSQMDIFYESMYELKHVKEKIGLLNDIDCMDYIYEKDEYKKIHNYKFKSLYCLELKDKKLYTPALLISLNYVITKDIEEWTIFNLEEY